MARTKVDTNVVGKIDAYLCIVDAIDENCTTCGNTSSLNSNRIVVDVHVLDDVKIHSAQRSCIRAVYRSHNVVDHFGRSRCC